MSSKRNHKQGFTSSAKPSPGSTSTSASASSLPASKATANIATSPASANASTNVPVAGQTNAWNRRLQPKTKTAPPPGMGAAPAVASSLNDKGPNKTQLQTTLKPIAPSSTSANGSSKTSGASSGLSMLNRERFLSLSIALVGHKVTVTQTDGSILEGVVHTYTPFHSQSMVADLRNKFVLKECRMKNLPEGSPAFKDGSTVILSADKIAYVRAVNVSLDTIGGPTSNGTATSAAYVPPGKQQGDALQTDSDISGGRFARSNDLVAAGSAWTSGGRSRADLLAGTLEDKGNRKGFGTATGNGGSNGALHGNIGQWDQFQANQKLFNVSASYDENLYTTELDKSRIDSRKIAEAERIAREIETTTSSNMHVAEERGHKLEGDFDEEDRYSGVLSKDGSQRHAAGNSIAKAKDKAASFSEAVSKTTATVDATKDNKDTTPKPTNTQPPKRMNYAAAAAKADAAKKAAPPGLSFKAPSDSSPAVKSLSTPSAEAKTKTVSTTDTKPSPDEPESTETTPVPPPSTEIETNKAEIAVVSKEKEVETKEFDSSTKKSIPDLDEKISATEPPTMKPKDESSSKNAVEGIIDSKSASAEMSAAKAGSKLNANAKTFTFNPSAKSFTPSFGGTGTSQAFADNQSVPHAAPTEPQMNVHIISGAPMQPAQYMHPSMGQPGMVPMISPHFAGIRYQSPYGSVDQHVSQMQGQMPQHPQQVSAGVSVSAPTATNANNGGNDNESIPSEGDASSQQTAPQPHPQIPTGMQAAYGMPPAYYPGGISMHARPGYPQFVSGPQPMSVGPGGAPYRHMYPGAMPPNMHMRPGGGPFYSGPGGPIPYGSGGYVGVGGMMEDSNDPNSRGRGGRGGGGGNNNGGRGRKGRGGRGRGGMNNNGGGNRNNYGNNPNNGRQTPQGVGNELPAQNKDSQSKTQSNESSKKADAE